MAEYNTRVRGIAMQDVVIDEGLRAYMIRVYNYMLMGLALTGGVALFTANTPAFLSLFFQLTPGGGLALAPLGWVALLAPLGLVFLLGFRIQQMTLPQVQGTFWAYSALMGVSLTPILFAYTGASVAQVFFITAAMFGATSLYGYTTGRDLTSFGSFLFMGLIGIMLASLVNMFLQSGMMQWVLSVIGVMIFTGLAAYDTQRIKDSYSVSYDGTVSGKMAVMGALSLYMDFVNLFLMLLRLMGDRR